MIDKDKYTINSIIIGLGVISSYLVNGEIDDGYLQNASVMLKQFIKDLAEVIKLDV